MRFCQDHWDRLRTALKERGIDQFGAKSGKEVTDDMVAQLKGQPTEFDPLMSCHWMITNRALEHGGLYLMGQKEDGTEYCPICEAKTHKPDDVSDEQVEDYWINGPADAMLGEARSLGLVPAVQ